MANCARKGKQDIFVQHIPLDGLIPITQVTGNFDGSVSDGEAGAGCVIYVDGAIRGIVKRCKVALYNVPGQISGEIQGLS